MSQQPHALSRQRRSELRAAGRTPQPLSTQAGGGRGSGREGAVVPERSHTVARRTEDGGPGAAGLFSASPNLPEGWVGREWLHATHLRLVFKNQLGHDDLMLCFLNFSSDPKDMS